MAVRFGCDCGGVLEVGDDLAGRRVRCPACRSIVRAPGESRPVKTAVFWPGLLFGFTALLYLYQFALAHRLYRLLASHAGL